MLEKVASRLERINEWVGKAAAWLSLFMILITFAVVIMRYVFSFGRVWIQEIVIYMHAILFLTTAGYTLLKNSQVRVDVLFQRLSRRSKAWIDLLGSIVFLVPTCICLAWFSWPFVRDSWQVFEGSKDGGGLEAIFILKSFILVFCLLLFLQAAASVCRSISSIRNKVDA